MFRKQQRTGAWQPHSVAPCTLQVQCLEQKRGLKLGPSQRQSSSCDPGSKIHHLGGCQWAVGIHEIYLDKVHACMYSIIKIDTRNLYIFLYLSLSPSLSLSLSLSLASLNVLLTSFVSVSMHLFMRFYAYSILSTVFACIAIFHDSSSERSWREGREEKNRYQFAPRTFVWRRPTSGTLLTSTISFVPLLPLIAVPLGILWAIGVAGLPTFWLPHSMAILPGQHVQRMAMNPSTGGGWNLICCRLGAGSGCGRCGWGRSGRRGRCGCCGRGRCGCCGRGRCGRCGGCGGGGDGGGDGGGGGGGGGGGRRGLHSGDRSCGCGGGGCRVPDLSLHPKAVRRGREAVRQVMQTAAEETCARIMIVLTFDRVMMKSKSYLQRSPELLLFTTPWTYVWQACSQLPTS